MDFFLQLQKTGCLLSFFCLPVCSIFASPARRVMQLRTSLFALWAALIAILSMATLPQGMMPVWGADGFSIELCSPGHQDSLKISRGDPDFETLRMIERAKRIAQGELPGDGGKAAQNAECDFASYSAKAALTGDYAASTQRPVTQIYDRQSPLTLAVLQRLHLPPSTGPPVS